MRRCCGSVWAAPHLDQDLDLLEGGVHAEHAADGDPPDAHGRAHRDAARERELQHALRRSARSGR